MRIVLDTNVFISGVFFTGPPYRILESWRDGKLRLVLSQEILEEYQRVGSILAEQYPDIDLYPMLELVAVKAEIFPVQKLPAPACEDPEDDKFIACALASKTKIIISGDKHLLKVSGFSEIRILNPRKFVDEYITRL